MKPTPDSLFVADLFAEGLEGPFREQLLARTIRTARRRRRTKAALRAAVVLAVAGLIALLFRRATPPFEPGLVLTSPPATPSVILVKSKPLPASAIVRSTPIDSITVRTPVRSNAPRASDDDLLASLGDRPAALVKSPGQPARLILAKADRKSRLH
jgi:hypothetical protein